MNPCSTLAARRMYLLIAIVLVFAAFGITAWAEERPLRSIQPIAPRSRRERRPAMKAFSLHLLCANPQPPHLGHVTRLSADACLSDAQWSRCMVVEISSSRLSA
jgi:hypothetical protein